MPELTVGQTLTTDEPLVPIENLPVGRHVIELRVEDDSGNLSQPARVIVVVRPPPPRITSFDPEFGRPKTRVVLRVSGLVSDDFAGDHQVLVNGVSAPVTGGSTKTLHIIVPAGATTGPLTLITGNGRGDSATPFTIPRSLLLPRPGATAPTFGPGGSLLAALDPDGLRVAIWNLKDPPDDLHRPESEAVLRNPASRLCWLTTDEVSGFLAWQPGSATAHLVVPGEPRSHRLRLPGATVDFRTPVAGKGEGAAAIFSRDGGDATVAVLRENVKTWTPLEPRAPRALALSHDGRRLALSAEDGLLLLLGLPDGRVVAKFPVEGGEKVERVFVGNKGGIWALAGRATRALLAKDDHVTGLDLGMEAESAGVPAAGDRLLCVGGGSNTLLVVRAAGADRLSGKSSKLAGEAQGEHALALSPEGRHAAVLHHGENSVCFVDGRTNQRTVTLPLGIMGGSRFAGGGKTPGSATSPEGFAFALATEEGLVVLESASVIV